MNLLIRAIDRISSVLGSILAFLCLLMVLATVAVVLSRYFLLSGKIKITKEGLEIGSMDKKGEIFGEMRVIDSMSRSATVQAVGKTICLAVDTSAKKRLSLSSSEDEKLDFLLLLYRIFAEFMSIRLRATNEELILAKKKVRRLIQQL